MIDVEAVLQQAVVGDLGNKDGLTRVVHAAAYRRQHGSFPALESILDEASKAALSEFEPISKNNSRAALDALEKLKLVSGPTPATLSMEAHAYHALEKYEKAEAAYVAWFKAVPPDDASREYMIAALLSARNLAPYFPPDGTAFRDCPECPQMIVVPAGNFMMGSRESGKGRYEYEGPVHSAIVREPFAIGKFEVTFAEWDACLSDGGCGGYRPDDRWGRGDQPVSRVAYRDAQSFVKWLSRKTGHAYRLPSETEWEYVARAGTTTPFHFGETINTHQANFDGRDSKGTSSEYRYRGQSIPVGSFPSNAFGVHDMHGNVWEWVNDCWTDNYANANSESNVEEESDCLRGTTRGGSWGDGLWYARSTNRIGKFVGIRNVLIGFRVARVLQ